MNEEALKWVILNRRTLLHTPIYDVLSQTERAADGLEGEYVAIQAPDWVMTIPVWQGQFILVRQWRHSAERLTLEFPGGVRDANEDPAETARRGAVNPNPALFKNTFHVYLAEELEPSGTQSLDPDELLTWETRPVPEVLNAWGSPEFCHGLMGTALAFYLLRRQEESAP